MMTHHFRPRSFTVAILFLLCSLLAPFRNGLATNGTVDLAAQVAALKLGMQGYTVGTRLSSEQKDASAANMVDNSYQGTYKFRDGELHIVVAEKDDTVLALYQRSDNTDFSQAKKMVSGLMGLYGNPTTMAHDKLIYWAYNNTGKISEERYNASREKADQLDVLATVKFSSEFVITAESTDNEEKGTIYFIVSSDRLTRDFIENE